MINIITWKTAPISCTCEVLLGEGPLKACDKPTVAAYPSAGGGWMALCERHSKKHVLAPKTDDLIANGETWDGLAC